MPQAIEKSQEILQIKVTLLGSVPPIWRRLLVPAAMTLEELHYVLQLVMGWEDDHLHEFLIGDQRFSAPDPLQGGFEEADAEDEGMTRLFEVLRRVRAKAVYTYDFGDSGSTKS